MGLIPHATQCVFYLDIAKFLVRVSLDLLQQLPFLGNDPLECSLEILFG